MMTCELTGSLEGMVKFIRDLRSRMPYHGGPLPGSVQKYGNAFAMVVLHDGARVYGPHRKTRVDAELDLQNAHLTGSLEGMVKFIRDLKRRVCPGRMMMTRSCKGQKDERNVKKKARVV